MNRNKGFTLIELLVVIAIIALLVGLLLPALAKAKRNAATLKDAAQIKEIHQSMLVFANEHKDVMPTPGLINRKADIYLGREQPGIGPEDYEKNTSKNLYSALIAQEYFNSDILIGPTEVNPIIEEYEDYDYTAYNPTQDTYWDGDTTDPLSDDGFQANIEDGTSNTSYHHLALCGLRKKLMWRNSADNNDAHLGSRASYRGQGESVGQGDPEEYTRSQTLLLHGSKKSWVGNIAYGDNHTELSETYYPALVSYEPQDGELTKDNVYDWEFTDFGTPGKSGDAFLCMTRTAGEDFVGDYHEELLP